MGQKIVSCAFGVFTVFGLGLAGYGAWQHLHNQADAGNIVGVGAVMAFVGILGILGFKS